MRHSKSRVISVMDELLMTAIFATERSAVKRCASEGIVGNGEARWTDRIYSPLVTLWMFLGQVLNADSSCRRGSAVDRALLVAAQSPCSAETGACCQDRPAIAIKLLHSGRCMVGRLWMPELSAIG